jgi:hypothetical protein
LTVGTGGTLNVDEGATVAVDRGGELVLDTGSAFGAGGKLDGTVTVGPGGVLRDTGSGSLWAPGATGSFVLSAGAKAYLGGGNTPIVGEPGNSTATIQLKTGNITLKADGYEFAGEAILQGPINIYSNQKLDLAEDAKIEVASGGELTLHNATGHLKGTIEVGNGGTLVDLNNRGSLWNAPDDTGGYVLHPGAEAYLDTDGDSNAELIVDQSGTGAPFLLTGGILELGRNGQMKLTGDRAAVTMRADTFPIGNAVIDSGAALTIASGVTPLGQTGSTITVVPGGTIDLSSYHSSSNFYQSNGTIRVGGNITGPGTYLWTDDLNSDGTTGDSGWRAAQ